MRLSLPLLALLTLAGCNRADTPVKAYTGFHEHVKKQEFKQAYEALSEESRKAIATRTQAVQEGSGGALKAEPPLLLFANSVVPADVPEVTLVSQEGDVATVRVVSSGQTREVRLVREASGWKIDLSESLKP
jgi:hypothetical protein